MKGTFKRALPWIALAWALALLVFWAIFFKLTPWLCNLIPASVGDWKSILSIAIYVAVGYAGGVGLPLFIGIGGSMAAYTWKEVA